MITLGSHMIPCRACLAAPTFVCIAIHTEPIDERGSHAIRIDDVAVLNRQILDVELYEAMKKHETSCVSSRREEI